MQIKERQSNLELLRIIAMLMILWLHICIGATGNPSPELIATDTAFTWLRLFVQTLCVPAVVIFVLISGYFGIRFRLNRFVGIVFQSIWIGLLIWITACIFDFGNPFDFKNLASLGLFTTNIWFVKSYLVLYLAAPFLNAFVERADPKQLGWMTLLFLLFTVVYGWTDAAPEFKQGYSGLCFMVYYLMGRYLRLYLPDWVKRTPGWCLAAVYLVVGIVNASVTMGILTAGWPEDIFQMISSYINPLTMLSAVCALLLFVRMQFQSRFINWVAASCLAVFLVHKHPVLAPSYGAAGWYFFTTFSGLTYFGVCMSFICVVFAASVLIDRIRMLCWRWVEPAVLRLEQSLPDPNQLSAH